jgi:hypothetical protein
MRWVCTHRCPAIAGCRRDVDAALAAGEPVVGTRAGESAAMRTWRWEREQRRTITVVAVGNEGGDCDGVASGASKVC